MREQRSHCFEFGELDVDFEDVAGLIVSLQFSRKSGGRDGHSMDREKRPYI